MKEIRTLQPYNFGELPPEMKEKAEKMIADIAPLGEVNEGTVDAVEAWSREDVLVLMRAMYNEALRQPRPIPSDVQEAADNYEKSLDYYHYTNDEPGIAYAAGMIAERERMMKEQSQPQWKPSEVQLDALWAALGVTDHVAGAWIENGGERSIGMSKDELHERLISLYKDLKNL